MPTVSRGATSGVGRERFAAAPMVVIWEVTRACDLACVHCRASALAEREAGELDTAEGTRLIAQVREFGKPLLVLTGGDPLKRADIHALIAAGSQAGLPTYLSPSGTPFLTHAALQAAKRAGLVGISISIDGSTAEIHDRFRGVPGSYQHCIEGAASAVSLGLGLQINTTLSRHNLHDLAAIAELTGALEARRWTIFLLVATGRATAGQQLAPDQIEAAFRWLHRLSLQAPFRIKTTEGPHYRRIALEAEAGDDAGHGPDGAAVIARGSRKFIPGISDGSGFLFISSLGEIHPSGFLPLSAGNVRDVSLVDAYRNHPLFVALRDPDRLQGRCGRCDYRAICGGSRARAYAATGDYLAEDPACAYQP